MLVLIKVESWKNVNSLIAPEFEYTKRLIEDMFDLLSKPPKKTAGAKESRMY